MYVCRYLAYLHTCMYTGNTHMWQAIQSAAGAVLSSDLKLANAILQVGSTHTYMCIHTFITV